MADLLARKAPDELTIPSPLLGIHGHSCAGNFSGHTRVIPRGHGIASAWTKAPHEMTERKVGTFAHRHNIASERWTADIESIRVPCA